MLTLSLFGRIWGLDMRAWSGGPGAPILYVLSFGSACWMAAAPRVVGQSDAPRLWMRLYFPIGAVIHYTQSQNGKPLRQWITFGSKKGERVIVPTDASGINWYGFTAE